jgi:hypothetical protein
MKSKRKTLIPIDDTNLEQILQTFHQLPRKGRSLKEVINYLYEELYQTLRKGYSYAEVIEMLGTRGITIAEPTLRQYMTGKSSFARGLLDIYQHLGIHCLAYDSDTQNPQLFRHYDKSVGVSCIDLSLRDGADVLLDDLEELQPQVALVDLPAGAEESFERYDRDVQLISAAAELGYRLTVVSVLSRVKDSVNALRMLMQFCGDRVDYITVKNLHFGNPDSFKRFDQSQIKQQFLHQRGIEVIMPDLFDNTYDAIDERDLTFREAVLDETILNRANRSRVNQWLNTMEAEVHKAGKYLGIRG